MQGSIDDFFLVIANSDGEHLLRRMLPSVDCPRDRILVVDIDSRDGSAALACESGCNVINLGRPSSYCQALNAGIRWALEKGANYIGLSNNDVSFATPVIGPLIEALRRERHLGIVAPTQVVAARKPPYKLANGIKYRSTWDLSSLRFEHDVNCPDNQPRLLEADFCEFTTVLVASAVFAEVGLLDEQFGFYYEDADFCFRAGLKGWRCGYLQTSQIIHYEGSTVSADKGFNKSHYLASNLRLFQQKHAVPGVSFEEVDNADELSSWPIASHFLCNTLHRYGLIDKNGPKMVYNHPNDDDCDILFTMWETDALPRHFIDRLGHYRHVLVGSNFNQRVFNNHHPSVHKIGLGVDPDRMNPWGGAFRFSDRKTFLSVFRDQYRKAFDVTVKAWIASGLWKDDCELVAYSPNLDHRRYMSGPGEVLRDANFVSTFDKEHKIRYLKPNRDIAFSEMSRIYRGSDFFVSSSRSEAFGLPVAEAMACGIPCIIPDYGACEEFVTPEGCISIPGRSAVADYSDKGFGDVGHWWEPDTAALSSAFKRAAALDEAECGAMGEAGRQHVLSQLTWRHAAFRFHEFSRQQLSGASRSVTAGGRGAATRRHWTRQFGRAALMLDLLRRGQLGRVLVLVGRFLQRRGH